MRRFGQSSASGWFCAFQSCNCPSRLEGTKLLPLQLPEMPEGPLVRKFQLLTSPFVGQVVSKVGGSTRKINTNDLNALRLQDCQVSCTKEALIGLWLSWRQTNHCCPASGA